MDALSGNGLSFFGASNVKLLKVMSLSNGSTAVGTFSFVHLIITDVSGSYMSMAPQIVMGPNQSVDVQRYTYNGGTIATNYETFQTTSNGVTIPSNWSACCIVYQIT